MQKILVLMMLALLAGCQTINSRGAVISEQQIQSIKAGGMTKDMVLQTLGAPTLTPDYDANIWYYIHRTSQQRVWVKPKITEQLIVKIIFTGNIVSDVVVIKDSHNSQYQVLNNHTPIPGSEQSSFKRFTSNFGRFSKSKDHTKRR